MLDELELLVEKELAKLNTLRGNDKQPLKESVNLIIQVDKSTKPDQQCSFRPMLSKKSLKMAEKLGDAKERLMRPRSVTPEPKKEPPVRKRTESNIAPRWEQLYTLDQFYRTKKEALKEQIELERSKVSETTFQPDLSKSQTRYCDFSMPFEQRNRYWEMKKKEKITQISQEKQKENESVCTFKPKVYKKIPDKNVKVSEFNKKGLITYFERVQLANKKKEEPKKVSKWKPGITVPQEFRLSHNKLL